MTSTDSPERRRSALRGAIRRAAAADRAAGRSARAWADRHPRVATTATGASGGLGPTFRAGLVVAIALPRSRAAGIQAALAAEVAARLAGVLRARIGRRRPGARADAALPSRHAASASAIATIAMAHRPAPGALVAIAASLGMTGRVVAREHDPADIAAGIAVGVGSALVVRRLAARYAAWRSRVDAGSSAAVRRSRPPRLDA